MNKSGSKQTRSSGPASQRSSRRRTRVPPGTVLVKYKELYGPVRKGTSQMLFVPGSAGLPHLDARGRMYEMYRLRGPVRVQYKAAVGATANGEVLIGVDYDARDSVLSYQGTAALSPKSMTPVWRDSTLTVPQNRAMKQRWLTTASDMAPVTSNKPPANYREDSIAFALNITSTGDDGTGSIWVEYFVEFASPRVPEPPVNLSVVTTGSGTSYQELSLNSTGNGFTCPVEPGNRFYVGVEGASAAPTLNAGYTLVDQQSVGQGTAYQIERSGASTTDVWGSVKNTVGNMMVLMASASFNALARRMLDTALRATS